MNKYPLNKKDVTKHALSSGSVFYYKGKLHVSWTPLIPVKLVNDINIPIQKITPTNFQYLGRSVWELKEHKHRIRLQESTKQTVKEFVCAMCDIHMASSPHNVYLYDVHEANINYTQDGIMWLDFGAFRRGKKIAANAMAYTGYFVQKYLYNAFKKNYQHYNLQHMKNSKLPTAKFASMDYTNPKTWEALKQVVNSIPVALPSSHWSDKYSNNMDIDHPEKVNKKTPIVTQMMDSIEFDTVTDVACNKGYYAMYAAKRASSVVGFDLDVKCVQSAINLARERKDNAIFAVKNVTDLCDNKMHESLRFSSDLVLALAIVHHLKGVTTIDKFAKGLSNISKKYIIIEDIGSAPRYRAEFEKLGFELQERVKSHPASRSLALYKRK